MDYIEAGLCMQFTGGPRSDDLPEEIVGSFPFRLDCLLERPARDFREKPGYAREFRKFLASSQDGIFVIWRDKGADLMANPMRLSNPRPAYCVLRPSIRRACIGRDQQLHATGPLLPQPNT